MKTEAEKEKEERERERRKARAQVYEWRVESDAHLLSYNLLSLLAEKGSEAAKREIVSPPSFGDLSRVSLPLLLSLFSPSSSSSLSLSLSSSLFFT